MNLFEGQAELLRIAPELLIKFFAAMLCGGAIGMEREINGKPAGLRTCVMIAIGTMLFTVVSMKMATPVNGDGTRIAAQIVSGIGFLGAGAILHDKGGAIRGMTTAAIIWLIAALGMLIGAGYVIVSIAITTISIVMILILKQVELLVNRYRGVEFIFVMPDTSEARERAAASLTLCGDSVQDIHFEHEGDDVDLRLRFHFIGPHDQRRELLEQLFEIRGMHIVGKRMTGSR